jgi:phospholipase/carboxylesterase
MSSPLDAYAHLHRPSPTGSRQTLVLLHGTGDNEVAFAGMAELIAPEAAVLSVRGNVSEGGLARFFRRKAEGVYDMDDLARRTAELIAFIDAAARHYRLERPGLVGIGYSNGANILANMLFMNAGVVAAAALLHPLIPFTPPPNPALRGKPVLITGGERDPICPPELTRTLADHFRQQGAATRLLFHPGGHELAPPELAAVRDFVAVAAGRGGASG